MSIYIAHKRETSDALYALVRSKHKRFQMLPKCISANSAIMQVVWQGVPHRQTTEKACQAVVVSQHAMIRHLDPDSEIQTGIVSVRSALYTCSHLDMQLSFFLAVKRLTADRKLTCTNG